tara:strand:- start:236 stop:457 length:222 start_codon:yes stop_codon:yes gene_type:complete
MADETGSTDEITINVPANMRELSNELGVSYDRLLRTAREHPEQLPMIKRVGRWYVLLPEVYIKWRQGNLEIEK